MDAVTNPPTLLFNAAQSLPVDANTSVSLTKREPAPGDDNGQAPVLQNLGQSLASSILSIASDAGSLPNAANQESGGPLLGTGDLTTSSPSGLNALFAGQGNLLLNQDTSSNNLVSSGADGLVTGGGVFLSQGASPSGPSLHLAGGALTATSVNVVNMLSDAGSQEEGNDTGQTAVQSGINSVLQTSPNQAVIRWLSTTWTASAPASRVSEAVADPQGSYIQTFSPSIPSANLGVQRPASVGAGIGADRGPQASAYTIGATRDANSTQLGGRDNEGIEKPGSGTGLFGRAPATSEAFDTGAASGNESRTRERILDTDLTVLGDEASAERAGADTEHAPDLTTSPVNAGAMNPPSLELPLSLAMVDSVSRLGLLQIDVTQGAPVPNDTSLRDSSGATAAYLDKEQSSIWSIVTTYSLVILPRQRKPQPTILVVDPDDATRDAVNVALVREGYFVLPAASVRDAWGMLRTPHSRIDLVLMDPHLPDVSGIHLCARLREISPTVPVMVCAGDVEPSEVDQLRQLGVRYYLRKPIAFEELLHTVRAILA